MNKLVLENLKKSYGDVHAVNNISLTVEQGEFLTLLGPSGCGKSTTLAAIAGLDRPTSGVIRFGDHVLFDEANGQFAPPEKRGFGVVFQSYALWPHLTVERNVSMPLELRKVNRQNARDASTRRWIWSGFQATASAIRVNCREASNSVLRWRVRWCSGRRSCCLTNRSPTSMRSCARVHGCG